MLNDHALREADEQARRAASEVARRSYGKLVALLAVRAHDVRLAEEALSDAFLAALRTWPRTGSPHNAEAWLLTAARRKLIDMARQQRRGALALDEQSDASPLCHALESMDGAEIPDHRLALMFACAHPAIDVAIRAPLMLQVVLGLDAAAIASAFLVSPATMGQRLSRAKAKIRVAGIPLRVPPSDELAARLCTVLDAVYAAYAEGWTDAGDVDIPRRDLASEAMFLGRLLVELLPDEPEALGLLALMLHTEARRRARRDEAGEYVPLAQQDPTSWDDAMIAQAEALLRRACALQRIGRYQIEGALQSAHVARRRHGHVDWCEVLLLYDALLDTTGSPVVAINRALVLGEVEGPTVALRALDELAPDPRLVAYQPYWVARAELLARTDAPASARDAYEVAIGLARDPAVRRFLQRRSAALAHGRREH